MTCYFRRCGTVKLAFGQHFPYDDLEVHNILKFGGPFIVCEIIGGPKSSETCVTRDKHGKCSVDIVKRRTEARIHELHAGTRPVWIFGAQIVAKWFRGWRDSGSGGWHMRRCLGGRAGGWRHRRMMCGMLCGTFCRFLRRLLRRFPSGFFRGFFRGMSCRSFSRSHRRACNRNWVAGWRSGKTDRICIVRDVWKAAISENISICNIHNRNVFAKEIGGSLVEIVQFVHVVVFRGCITNAVSSVSGARTWTGTIGCHESSKWSSWGITTCAITCCLCVEIGGAEDGAAINGIRSVFHALHQYCVSFENNVFSYRSAVGE